MQQRLFQLVQRGQLLLVDGFEALDFRDQYVKTADNFSLFSQRRQRNWIRLQFRAIDIGLIDAGNHYCLAVVQRDFAIEEIGQILSIQQILLAMDSD